MTTATDSAYDAAIAYAADLGAQDGRAAASWYFDGNTARDTYTAVLRGIDDGDPAVLDTLPMPDLRGEWADSLTGPMLIADAIAAGNVGPHAARGPMGHAPGACETCDAYDAPGDICDAYEVAFTDAATAEIVRAAQYQLAED